MPAQLRELGAGARGDLIAEIAERHFDDLLHPRGRIGEHDDPIGEVDRLVDVMRDDDDCDAQLAAHGENQILQPVSGLRVDRGEPLIARTSLTRRFRSALCVRPLTGETARMSLRLALMTWTAVAEPKSHCPLADPVMIAAISLWRTTSTSTSSPCSAWIPSEMPRYSGAFCAAGLSATVITL